ncbi:MAG TPA: hypothetical protein VFQ38_00165 [Longimicrobiales bacterium]|nr:hypothetical protein [Longimicrobiales bacterium]
MATILNAIIKFLGEQVGAAGYALTHSVSAPAFVVTALAVAAFGVVLIRATRPRG